MSNETMTALARRAVACKAWRWMPGMLTLPFHEGDDRTKDECYPPWRVRTEGIAGPWSDDATWGALPDLDDPATRGCLLALVREAWSDPTAHTIYDGARNVWSCCPLIRDAKGRRHGRMLALEGATEAEALVTALEAAP